MIQDGEDRQIVRSWLISGFRLLEWCRRFCYAQDMHTRRHLMRWFTCLMSILGALPLALTCLDSDKRVRKRGGEEMVKPPKTLGIMFFVCILLFSACAQKRPVLYPNYHLEEVGDEQAQADIDECMRFAAEYGAKSSSGGEVAKRTAGGAAVGGAAGAGIGAVTGSVGRGAAAGAAGGAAAALTRGIIRSGEPDPVFRRFVEKCLREKGYEPVGWR